MSALRAPAVHRLCTLLVLAAASAGCQPAQGALADAMLGPPPAGAAMDLAREGDHAVLRTGGARIAMRTGESLPLPADFPPDVFLPPDYAINSVTDMGPMQVVSLQAPGQVGRLFADARARMAREGWKQTMAMQSAADTALLSYEKAQRAAVLSFDGSQDPDKVSISVQLRTAHQ